MKNHNPRPVLRQFLRRVLILGVLAAVLTATLSIGVSAQHTYQITDGSSVTLHTSYATDPGQVLQEAGFSLGANDFFTFSRDTEVSRIHINRRVTVTVSLWGEEQTVTFQNETVGQLLARLGVQLEEKDRLSCDVNSYPADGMTITVSRSYVDIVEYEGPVAFETITTPSPQLKGDETRVLSQGKDGVALFTAEVIYENGQEVSRQILSQRLITAPVPRQVLVSPGNSTKVQENVKGDLNSFAPTEQPTEAAQTRPSAEPEKPSPAATAPGTTSTSPAEAPAEPSEPTGNTFTTLGGETFTYSRVLTCTATAYSCEGYTGYTASGTVARVGAIAVDPRVIPLGSRLYIVTDDGYCIYGFCTAEDTGSAVKGNYVDLYFDTIAECYAFGRRTATVYVLD